VGTVGQRHGTAVSGGVGGGGSVTARAEGLRRVVQKGLQQFDAQHGPEVGEIAWTVQYNTAAIQEHH
jgi:hypothetical protein